MKNLLSIILLSILSFQTQAFDFVIDREEVKRLRTDTQYSTIGRERFLMNYLFTVDADGNYGQFHEIGRISEPGIQDVINKITNSLENAKLGDYRFIRAKKVHTNGHTDVEIRYGESAREVLAEKTSKEEMRAMILELLGQQ